MEGKLAASPREKKSPDRLESLRCPGFKNEQALPASPFQIGLKAALQLW
jgi:hypothetical protein